LKFNEKFNVFGFDNPVAMVRLSEDLLH